MNAATSATHSNLVISVRSIIAGLPRAPTRTFYCVTAHPVWATASGLIRRIDRHPIAIGEPVGLVLHAGDRHQLAEHGLGHAGLARRRAVAGDAIGAAIGDRDGEIDPVSYTHLRAHETGRNLVCRLLLEKK